MIKSSPKTTCFFTSNRRFFPVLWCILASSGRLWGLPWDALGVKMASKSDGHIDPRQFFFDLGEFGGQNSNFHLFGKLWGWFWEGFRKILRGFEDNLLRFWKTFFGRLGKCIAFAFEFVMRIFLSDN